MDFNGVVNILLPVVFCLVGIALVFLIIELIKTLRVAQSTITGMTDQLAPTLKNVETITTDIQPAINKIDPLMERVQLTVDSVNLEMMRVDQILEDVADITDSASSATAAVDNITNVPLKAVNNVAARVKTAFGGKGASEESTQLAEQRVAVAQALEDYKAAEEKEARKTERAEKEPEAQPLPESEFGGAQGEWHSYVKDEPNAELVIDPEDIANSPFFNDTDEN